MELKYDELKDEPRSKLVINFNSRPYTEGEEFETKKDAQIFRNARDALRKHTAKTLKTLKMEC